MTTVSSSTRLLLTLSMLKGVGPAALKKASATPRFVDLTIEDLANAVPQIGRALEGTDNWQIAQDEAAKQIDKAVECGARVLSPLDADYPHLLAKTKDDPFLLFVKGSLAKVPERSVAIIGTREPTGHGKVIAQRITHFFVEQGWSVVSGLAIGCDAIAHQAALDAHGHTVAVLAHGLQTIAPSRHKKLAEDILGAGGALVSEYPFGRNVQSQQFVKRDRTQAGMAQGVVMIQSDLKGGSLHASRAALDYARWLAVPYPTEKDRQRSEPKIQANLLIADGVDAERASLLRCSTNALQRVRVLRGREDYLRLTESSGQATSASTAAYEQLGESLYSMAADMPALDASNQPPYEADEHFEESTAFSMAEAPDAESVATPEVPLDGSETREVLPPTPSPRHITRYHIEVKSTGSADLQVVQLSTATLESWATKDSRTHNFEALVVLSMRLQHLQERLDEVKRKSAASEASADERNRLQLQFSIEDVLTHMRHAADDVARYDLDIVATHLAPSVADESSGIKAGTQLALAGYDDREPQPNISLVEMLDQLLTPLPRPFAPSASLPSNYTATGEDCIDVYLDDLVRSFNGFVSSSLCVDLGSSKSGGPRGHARQLG